MSNLVKLTLPKFDWSLLAQHTAFGLCSLTFMCSKMFGEEMLAFFTWLDGQINVVELTFPMLEDITSVWWMLSKTYHRIPHLFTSTSQETL
jgi:hypothetical protein